MTHEGPIGITGATGYIGSHVARLLAERGIPQRLIARDPARLPSLLGAQTASVSSYGDAEGMRDALEGASTLFLASGRDAPNRVQQHMTAVDAHLLERLRHLMNVAPWRSRLGWCLPGGQIQADVETSFRCHGHRS